jgi:hypothetical protein
VLDQAPPGTAAAPAPIHQTPNVDATVIELGSDGRPVAVANVLLSPQYPHGQRVPLDRNMATDKVRWRQWSDAEWDDNHGLGTIDAVPGHENAPLEFTSPYPASLLKLMVGFGVLRLVDSGGISLDDTYAYTPVGTPSSLCGPARPALPVRQLFDEMITFSSNPSAGAMVKLLHEHDAVAPLNQLFAGLGLEMLQLDGTNPNTGGNWTDQLIMNSLDTAKLLLIVSGAPGVLWKAPDGTPVTREVLSASSRQFYLAKLGDQGLNQVLATTNWCGRAYPAQGIPARVPQRWIDPADGTVTIDGCLYGQDVRPCNAAAEVTFAHKTGLVDTAGGDAGIVRSLPRKQSRRYIVAVHSNLGTRYVDPDRPPDPPGILPVAYSEKYALLGREIDRIVTGHHD